MKVFYSTGNLSCSLAKTYQQGNAGNNNKTNERYKHTLYVEI